MAQIITIVSQPVVIRLYSPEEFGALSILISVVSILSPLLTMQYHMGIVSARSDKEANVLCALSLYIILIVGLIITLGLIVFRRVYPSFFNEIGNLIYVAIPLLVISGVGKILDSYNNRFEQYRLMASISLVRSFVSNLLRIVLGLLNSGLLGLITSHFVSIIFGFKRQTKYINTKYNEIFNTSIKEMKLAAVKYKVQPLFSLPGLFVTTISFSILPIFINELYSIKEAGYFSITMMVLGIPLTLISNNVARIFFRKASIEKNQKGNFLNTFKSTALLLLIISLTGFTILWFSTEQLFSVVFGEEWIKSGAFVKILVPLFAVRFIVSSLMHGFIISGKQQFKLILQGLFIVEAISIYFFVKLHNLSIEIFLELINNAYFINYVIIFFALYLTSKKTEYIDGGIK